MFHLVIEDSVRQLNMSSRHRCLNGLRSVLHISARNDIKTLTVPLLLVYEMSEVSIQKWLCSTLVVPFGLIESKLFGGLIYMVDLGVRLDQESLSVDLRISCCIIQTYGIVGDDSETFCGLVD